MTRRAGRLAVALAVVIGGFVAGLADAALAGPATAQSTADRAAGFHALVGPNVVVADDFQRPDQPSLKNPSQLTPTGQLLWQPTRANALHPIVNRRYAPIITPAQAAYARLFVPGGYNAIGGRFVMVNNGTTHGQNAVIGSGLKTFGTNGDGGSIQLATWDRPILYAPSVRIAGAPDLVLPLRPIQWLAFQVEDPVRDPYIPVYHDLAVWLASERDPDELRGAYGLFEDGFTLEADTEYVQVMRKVDHETVEVDLPDGQTHSFRDPVAVGRWGLMGAIQTRRGTHTDGTVVWTGVAIAVPPVEPAGGSVTSSTPVSASSVSVEFTSGGRWGQPGDRL